MGQIRGSAQRLQTATAPSLDCPMNAHVHERAAPAANGEGRFAFVGREMQDVV
jgi:hypothetical protein